MNPEEMAALHAACFRVPRPWAAQEFRDLLDSPGVLAFGEARGFVLLRSIAGEAEILTLAVDPDARRQGMGRRLVQQALSHARETGVERVLLEVVQDNVAAIALYTRCGFRESGLRKDYYHGPKGEKAAALVMECLISSA